MAHKVATVNSMLKAVSILYIWARKQGLHEGVNPTSGLRRTPPNLLALQKILGHSKFEMTQIYSHLAPDYLAGEIARLSFELSPSQPDLNASALHSAPPVAER